MSPQTCYLHALDVVVINKYTTCKNGKSNKQPQQKNSYSKIEQQRVEKFCRIPLGFRGKRWEWDSGFPGFGKSYIFMKSSPDKGS